MSKFAIFVLFALALVLDFSAAESESIQLDLHEPLPTLHHYTDEEKDRIRKSCDPFTERYGEMISACPPRCVHGHRQMMRCMAIIYRPSCICKPGLLRDSVSDRCISPSDCVVVA